MGVSIGDSLAATYGCIGALAALRHRDLTGEGQVVDSALYEAVLQVMESLIPEYTEFGYVRERSGSVLPGIAPSNVYRCKDGDFLIGANQDTVFGRLCTAMGQPELASDPRYIDHISRGKHQAELDDRINAWTATQTVEAVQALMIEYGIPAGRVYKPADMIADPHFQARQALVDVPHPRWNNLKMQGVFPKLSKSPGGIRSIAPQSVGEDNRSVYGQLGIDDKALAALTSKGIL
jgi:crotonobetainyl-CoA:carnitine CoA-transferase CaiB-like acyl-CoA transferase